MNKETTPTGQVDRIKCATITFEVLNEKQEKALIIINDIEPECEVFLDGERIYPSIPPINLTTESENSYWNKIQETIANKPTHQQLSLTQTIF